MVIQHNLAGLNSKRNQRINESKLRKNLEKLSSGYRINRAGDNAAGLAISESLRHLIGGSRQALDNIGDGINLIQTAEGAMQEIHSMLNRMYECSIASSNDMHTDDKRELIQEEVERLKQEIQRISDNSRFNYIQLLNGTDRVDVSNVAIQADTMLPAWVTMPSRDDGYMSETYTTEEIAVSTNATTGSVTSSTTYRINHAAATLDFTAIDRNPAKINELLGKGFYSTCFTCDNHYSIRFTRGTSSSMETSGDHYIYNIGVGGIGTSEELVNAIINGTQGGNPDRHFTKLEADAAQNGKLIMYDDRSSDPSDPRVAGETWDTSWTWAGYFGYNHVEYPETGKFGAGVAVDPSDIPPVPYNIQFQIGPDGGENIKIDLPDIALGSGGLDIEDVSVATQENANAAISQIKGAIDYVSQERGRMGVYHNRLEYAERSLAINHENLTAMESRIRDTDMADEITSYTKSNIIHQAAQSMLIHANAVPQSVLDLLQ